MHFTTLLSFTLLASTYSAVALSIGGALAPINGGGKHMSRPTLEGVKSEQAHISRAMTNAELIAKHMPPRAPKGQKDRPIRRVTWDLLQRDGLAEISEAQNLDQPEQKLATSEALNSKASAPRKDFAQVVEVEKRDIAVAYGDRHDPPLPRSSTTARKRTLHPDASHTLPSPVKKDESSDREKRTQPLRSRSSNVAGKRTVVVDENLSTPPSKTVLGRRAAKISQNARIVARPDTSMEESELHVPGLLAIYSDEGILGFVSKQLSPYSSFQITRDPEEAAMVTRPYDLTKNFQLKIHGQETHVAAVSGSSEGNKLGHFLIGPSPSAVTSVIWTIDSETMELIPSVPSANGGRVPAKILNNISFNDLVMTSDVEAFKKNFNDEVQHVKFFFVEV